MKPITVPNFRTHEGTFQPKLHLTTLRNTNGRLNKGKDEAVN